MGAGRGGDDAGQVDRRRAAARDRHETTETAWHDDPRYQDEDRPLAPDEQELLEKLTRICRGILLEDAPPSAL